MVVRVGGVDFEPVVGGVARVLGVRAFARPVFFGHVREQLRGGRARVRLRRIRVRIA